jgi:hypothetical protein
MKFTKEEIIICKKIWERQHRKTIEYGDWLLNEGGFAKVWPYRYNCKRTDVIPLWQISDCLEFIFERGLYLLGLCQSDECEFSFGYCETDEMGIVKNEATIKEIYGKTPLEACLKAILAILEEL